MSTSPPSLTKTKTKTKTMWPPQTKFRFKSTHSHSRSRSRSPITHTHRHHRHHHHHHRRTHHSPSPTRSLSPTTAFRESLFDALADDEGAAFWEGVYGQPIHAYPRLAARGTTDGLKPDNGEEGELEAMTDEEYVSYVRAKMWERSHQHIIEERARREEERKRKRKVEEEGRWWERSVEEALRRGEERRRGKRWGEAWGRYGRGWEEFLERVQRKDGWDGGKGLRKYIPWPVLSGRWEDVEKSEVERFFRHAPQKAKEQGDDSSLGAVLKSERVRWHPDKMQQRAGSGRIDAETMRVITAVFQVVDDMWLQAKSN